MRRCILLIRMALPLLFALTLFLSEASSSIPVAYPLTRISVNSVFDQAARDYGVPVVLLKAICFLEGHLSNHNGSPSIDNGYGCMHLTRNSRSDTLDQAAKELNTSAERLQNDMPTNIRGGATLLRNYALQLSSSHTLPAHLADWYGAVAAYSNAITRSTSLMYADNTYNLLNKGFSAQADGGEMITLVSQNVKPNTATASSINGLSKLPTGCKVDKKVDFSGAIDCILNPKIYDCNLLPATANCTYQDAHRPHDFSISLVVTHDIEGTAQDALNVFQDVTSGVSVHYVVDSDGTIYQLIREKDIAYHAGNFWYNEHSIGIENAGFDATGFQWYNATEYMASARLAAYLLKKYHIPLDHAHVVSHGTIPSPYLAVAPNHVDPGPYWLWDYYLKLMRDQDAAMSSAEVHHNILGLHPTTDMQPFGANGTETPANFNFFYLYNGPSTASGLIPQQGSGADITDVTNNVEPDMSYYYLDKVKDPAGTGATMYEIWYGEEAHAHDSINPTLFANAKLAWLAVPPGAAEDGHGTIVKLSGEAGKNIQVYGRPTTNSKYVIGDAPNNAQFVSAFTVVEDGTNNHWYEINYNHRQAWVPADEVSK